MEAELNVVARALAPVNPPVTADRTRIRLAVPQSSLDFAAQEYAQ